MLRRPRPSQATTHIPNTPVVIKNEELKLIQLSTVYYIVAVRNEEGGDFLNGFLDIFLDCRGIEADEAGKVDALRKEIKKRMEWLMPMVRHVRAVMDWRKFIEMGIKKGENWDREKNRIRETLEGSWGVPKLIFVHAGERGDSDGEDIDFSCT